MWWSFMESTYRHAAACSHRPTEAWIWNPDIWFTSLEYLLLGRNVLTTISPFTHSSFCPSLPPFSSFFLFIFHSFLPSIRSIFPFCPSFLPSFHSFFFIPSLLPLLAPSLLSFLSSFQFVGSCIFLKLSSKKKKKDYYSGIMTVDKWGIFYMINMLHPCSFVLLFQHHVTFLP